MGQDEAGKNVDPQQPALPGDPRPALGVVEDLVDDDRKGPGDRFAQLFFVIVYDPAAYEVNSVVANKNPSEVKGAGTGSRTAESGGIWADKLGRI